MARVLYLSYDGLLEPLGESQVVSYLERLARAHEMTVLSYEKPVDLVDRDRLERMDSRLSSVGIEWLRLPYTKSPPVLSTVLDVRRGIRRLRGRAGEFDIIHARSYVAALITLSLLRRSEAKYVFDMRGFWVDEKVEGGHWKAGGPLYRIGKWWERRFLRAADAVVSLTEAGIETLAAGDYPLKNDVLTAVIPTCVDTARFAPGVASEELAEELELPPGRIYGCVGTVSNWYMRREMLEFLAVALDADPDAGALFVTRDDHDALRRDAIAAGIDADRLRLTRSGFADMPRYFPLMDVGVFFIRPTFAKRGSAATKMAEFLATGTPVVINDGVGDSGRIVRSREVGVVLDALRAEDFRAALESLDRLLMTPELGERCRRAALDLFDLEAGAERYSALYRELVGA